MVAIVNMTSNRFELQSDNCVGTMSNSIYDADGGILMLDQEMVNTIFGNIGMHPVDPK